MRYALAGRARPDVFRPEPVVLVEHPQQYYLDFRVPDLEKATEHAMQLGATRAGEQPNEKLWRVMIDPDGHPFCLCPPRD